MAKKKKPLREFLVSFYERIISEFEDNEFPVLQPTTFQVYTIKQLKFLCRRQLYLCGKVDTENKYGSVSHKYGFKYEFVRVVPEEEIKQQKLEKAKKKDKKKKKKDFEQLSLFDNDEEDK